MSDLSLAKKLQIKAGKRLLIANDPGGYLQMIGMPEGASVSVSADGEFDIVLAFFTERAALDAQLNILKSGMSAGGILWVAYPKGTSGVATDLNRDILRAHLDSVGLKAVALVAIDDTWSALRLKPA